jgi:hypothetical protein
VHKEMARQALPEDRSPDIYYSSVVGGEEMRADPREQPGQGWWSGAARVRLRRGDPSTGRHCDHQQRSWRHGMKRMRNADVARRVTEEHTGGTPSRRTRRCFRTTERRRQRWRGCPVARGLGLGNGRLAARRNRVKTAPFASAKTRIRPSRLLRTMADGGYDARCGCSRLRSRAIYP